MSFKQRLSGFKSFISKNNKDILDGKSLDALRQGPIIPEVTSSLCRVKSPSSVPLTLPLNRNKKLTILAYVWKEKLCQCLFITKNSNQLWISFSFLYRSVSDKIVVTYTPSFCMIEAKIINKPNTLTLNLSGCD